MSHVASDKQPDKAMNDTGFSCPECHGVVHRDIGCAPLSAGGTAQNTVGHIYYACEACPYFFKAPVRVENLAADRAALKNKAA